MFADFSTGAVWFLLLIFVFFNNFFSFCCVRAFWAYVYEKHLGSDFSICYIVTSMLKFFIMESLQGTGTASPRPDFPVTNENCTWIYLFWEMCLKTSMMEKIRDVIMTKELQ